MSASVSLIKIVAGVLHFLLLGLNDNKTDSRMLAANNSTSVRKIELFDGVSLNIPEHKDGTEKLLSFDLDTKEIEETGRGKQKKLMQRILPLFIMPFVIQSTLVPVFLGLLKFMLFKSLMIGKLALVLIIINAFRNSNSFKARQDESIANIHYGYYGKGMEYGSYFNS